MMPLAVMMKRDIRSVEADATLKSVAESLAEGRVGAMLVKKNGEYCGIVSETDLVRRAMAQGIDPETCPVEKIMSAPLITIDIEQTVVDANEIMSEKAIRHLVVTEKGAVCGILSVRDLVLYFKNRL
ncbi:MAG: CBS domain-containing protein [Nitrospirota bacterium]|nr:CBS domain-containing protein [Nitrospirota bacterium]